MSPLPSTTSKQLIDILRKPLDELPDPLVLVPVPGPFDVSIRPPGSKSLMNRAVLLAALAEGKSKIFHALLDAQDAKVMIQALTQLGARFELPSSDDGPLIVHGTGGKLKGGCSLNLENAGTATRFLTAAACLADAPVVIDGNDRMRKRPIGELIEMLRRLGVTIDELGEPGYVPLRVHPCRPKGSEIEIGATQSSQYISALMMIAPFMEDGLTIRFTQPPTSRSYIEMTLQMLTHALPGAPLPLHVTVDPLVIPNWNTRGFEITIEPDASGATYFCGAAAILIESRCVIEGFDLERSAQGDARFRDVLGAREIDLSLMPDTAQTLASIACFTDGTTTIRGLRTLRVKETDRIAALQNELAKIRVMIEPFSYTTKQGTPDEGITITPPSGGVDCSPTALPVVFDTYDDHRMAMSLALIGLRRPNVAICDPGCVGKTYPAFWRDWSRLYESAVNCGVPKS